MTEVPPLLVLRHGETVWNRAGRLQGRGDSELTALGWAQALRQRDILAGHDLAGFGAFVSPLGRARQTADIVLRGFAGPVRTDQRLAEVDVGAWQGLTWDAVAPDVAAEDRLTLYDAAPGGEGLAALEARCAEFLRDLSGPAVLVTHGVTARMVRALATGQTSRTSLAELSDAQGCVYHVASGVDAVLT